MIDILIGHSVRHVDNVKVEKMDVETGLWIPCGRSEDCQLTVKGLTAMKRYKFRVCAINEEVGGFDNFSPNVWFWKLVSEVAEERTRQTDQEMFVFLMFPK